ncbi:1757_t:CDS:2 [Ambispora gerdemannii]|uniref:1757_t:CDS:1 n=1 Tax=Ambispora gerdemannii TaxID=144530 RepID=A0A9N8V161_9GLOM|nr:1757_t:CDS:2 [Ambispora gerdemannii]
MSEFMEEKDVDFFEFRLLRKNKNRISIAPGPLDETKISVYASLLAISNKYGYLVAGTKAGFMITRTHSLRQAFKSETSEVETVVKGSLEVKVSKGPVEILKISADQLTVFAGIKGGIIQLFDVTTLFNGENSTFTPYRELSFNEAIRDIRPNPGPSPNIIAILFNRNGMIMLKDFIEDKTLSTISPKSAGDQISAVCWSPKGKHLICGTASGKLIKFDTDGSSSAGIQPPPDLSKDGEAYRVLNVLWLEKAQFLVSYYPMIVSEDSEAILYLVSSEQSPPIFTKVEVTPWKSSRQDRQSYYFMETIRDWGSNVKNLVILADALSTDTSYIACDNSGEWTCWILDSSDAIVMPIPRFAQKYDDTLPFGMAIDFTDTEEWLTKIADDTVSVPPVPIVYILNDEGDLLAYRCFNEAAFEAQETCTDMVIAQNIPSTGPSALIKKHLPEPEPKVVVNDQTKLKPLSKITLPPPDLGVNQKKPMTPVFTLPSKIATTPTLTPTYKTPDIKVFPSPSKATLLEEDNIRDVERFLKETDRLYKGAKSLVQKFFTVKQEVSDLNDHITKAHRLIEYIGNAMDPESKPILPDKAIKSLSDEAMNNIRGTLETIKDAAQVVEERLILLHDLIEEKKKKNIAERSPLEMIESSILNITTTLMYWQRQLNTMGDDVQKLYAEKQYRSQPEKQETIEQSFSARELDISSYLRYSPEAGKQIDSYLKQTHMMKRIGNKLRNRKTPILTKPAEGDQSKATIASSNVIGNITTYSPNNILETSHKTRPPIATADSFQTTSISSLSIIDSPTKNILQVRRLKESIREKKEKNAPYYVKSKHEVRTPEPYDSENHRLSALLGNNKSFSEYVTAFPSIDKNYSRLSTSDDAEDSNDSIVTAYRIGQRPVKSVKENFFGNTSIKSSSELETKSFFDESLQNKFNNEANMSFLDIAGKTEPKYESRTKSEIPFIKSISQNKENIAKYETTKPSENDSIQKKLEEIANLEISPLGRKSEGFELLMSAAARSSSEEQSLAQIGTAKSETSVDESKIDTRNSSSYEELSSANDSFVNIEKSEVETVDESSNKKFADILATDESKVLEIKNISESENSKDTTATEDDIVKNLEELEMKPETDQPPQQEAANKEIELTRDKKEAPLVETQETIENVQSETPTLENDMDMGGITQSLESTYFKETVNSSSNETSGFGTPSPAPTSFPAPATGGSLFPPSANTPSQINAFGAPSIPSGLAQPTFGQPSFGQPAFGQPVFGQPAFGQPSFGQPAFGQPSFGQSSFSQTPGFGANPSLTSLKTPSSGGFARFAASGIAGAVGFGKSPDPNATQTTTNTNTPNNPNFTQFRG